MTDSSPNCNGEAMTSIAKITPHDSEPQLAQQEKGPLYSTTSNAPTTVNTLNSLSNRLTFRTVAPTDIDTCYELESSSYPNDEAASLATLQYRQHHAMKYFRCAILNPETATGDDGQQKQQHAEETIVGFINATKCHAFEHDALMVHVSSGPLLAIHSVVVAPEYRRKGIATAMLQDYIEQAKQDKSLTSIVLMAKSNLLGFYVMAGGFSVLKPSEIVHGQDQWFDLRLDLPRRENSGLPCRVVDAFCIPNVPASGNQAGVVLLSNAQLKEEKNDVCNDELELEASTSSSPSNKHNSENGETSGGRAAQPEWIVPSEKWMQSVAKEFGYSETAFVWKKEKKTSLNSSSTSEDDNGNTNNINAKEKSPTEDQNLNPFCIKYFTCDGTEVDLCGHATLASGATILQAHNLSHVSFHANHNVVLHAKRATKDSTSNNTNKVIMDFPTKSWRELSGQSERAAAVQMLEEGLGIGPLEGGDADEQEKDDDSTRVGKDSEADSECEHDVNGMDMNGNTNKLIYMGLDEDGGDLLVELTPTAFEEIGYGDRAIQYGVLSDWGGYSRGIIVCATSSKESVDFVSRFFAPKVGIPEDPVTGSAHCVLAPYFCKKLNKTKVVGRQRSTRGGLIECKLLKAKEAGGRDRVEIGGSTLTTISGTLLM